MHKSTVAVLIGIITALTVLLTLTQNTVIQQLVVWAGGIFAVLVALAIFIVLNWPQQEEKQTPVEEHDRYIFRMTRHYRSIGYQDSTIADALNTDIEIIKAIPQFDAKKRDA